MSLFLKIFSYLSLFLTFESWQVCNCGHLTNRGRPRFLEGPHQTKIAYKSTTLPGRGKKSPLLAGNNFFNEPQFDGKQ